MECVRKMRKNDEESGTTIRRSRPVSGSGRNVRCKMAHGNRRNMQSSRSRIPGQMLDAKLELNEKWSARSDEECEKVLFG